MREVNLIVSYYKLLRGRAEDKLSKTLFQIVASGAAHAVRLLHCRRC